MKQKKPFVLKEAGLTVYEKYIQNTKSTFEHYLINIQATNDNHKNSPRNLYIQNVEEKKTKAKPGKKFLIEGHRGYNQFIFELHFLGSGVLEFENTLAAFQKAIDLNLDSCELDIWLSKDKVPIVFHGGRKGELAIKGTTSYYLKKKINN